MKPDLLYVLSQIIVGWIIICFWHGCLYVCLALCHKLCLLHSFKNEDIFTKLHINIMNTSSIDVQRTRVVILFSFWTELGPFVNILCIFLFITLKLLKISLTLSSLSLWSGLSHPWILTCPLMQKGFQSKIKNRMANRVDPDDYESSGVHYLHGYLF